MNYEQFKQYLKEHGVTAARITEDFWDTPKGTVLWFGYKYGYISSALEKNIGFGYDFDYRYWWNKYDGDFELVHGWDYLKKGDILVGGGEENGVLAVVGDLVFVSYYYDFGKAGGYWTKQELQKLGYTIKDAPETK